MENIQKLLELFGQHLNATLRAVSGLSEDCVVLSNLVEADGSRPPAIANKVVLTLLNIEIPALPPNPRPVAPAGTAPPTPRPAPFNLYLLAFANFSGANYPTALGMIAQVIDSLEKSPVLTHASLPGLAPTIASLAFEFVNLDASQWSDYLRMAGVPYQPSALYRCRVLPNA